MKKTILIKLPFIETICRSFMYVLCNWKLYSKVASFGLVVLIFEMAGGFPVLCSLSDGNCQENIWQTVSSLLILLVSVGIIVNYCRAVILKAPTDFISAGFWKRSLKYILATLLLGLVIVVPFLLLGIIYGTVLSFAKTVSPLSGADYIVMFVALIAWCVYLAPIFLVFAAITVDDKTVTIKEAFHLTKGNFNKIFWGQSVMMIPGAILLYILAFAYNGIGGEGFVINTIFTILVLALSFLDSCLKASFFAHIYQYFIFYKNKKAKSAK